MASVTTPLAGPGDEDRPAKAMFRMTLHDRTVTLDPDRLGPGDAADVRRATGLPLRAFFTDAEDGFDLDTLAVLWWLGRRKNGEPKLKYRTVLYEITGYDVMADFTLEVVDENGDIITTPATDQADDDDEVFPDPEG